MSERLTPDLCIIGAGAAGLAAAAAGAALNLSTVLIERDRCGGQYVHRGDVPARATAYAARRGFDAGATRAHVAAATAAAAGPASAARLGAMNVDVRIGAARFFDARQVRLGDTTIAARHFLLAGGSVPILPPLPGLADARHATTDTWMDLPFRPDRLVVLGTDARGLEIAQTMRLRGALVTIVPLGPLLPDFDAEMADALRLALQRGGLAWHEGDGPEGIEATGDGVRIRFAAGAPLEASHLLVAAGRRPDIDALGLPAAGIAVGPGGLRLRGDLRTTNRRVWAAGDIAGARCTAAATAQARLAVKAACLGLPGRWQPDGVAHTVHTHPVLAATGLSEAAARARHRRIGVLRWPIAELDRARAEGETEGHVKLVTTRSGRLLGASLLAPQADETIALWQLALSRRLAASDIAALVAPAMTYNEAGSRALQAGQAARLRGLLVRRALALLRRLR